MVVFSRFKAKTDRYIKVSLPRRSVRAFSLVEVVLALGIVSFCVISVLGLLLVGLKSNGNSTNETAVTSSVLTAIISDISATPTTSSKSPQFQIPIPGTSATTNTLFFKDDGSLVSSTGVNQDATASENPRYRATVAIMPPTNAQNKGATQVWVFLTWPALANLKAATPVTNYTGSIETMAAFLRN